MKLGKEETGYKVEKEQRQSGKINGCQWGKGSQECKSVRGSKLETLEVVVGKQNLK